MYIPSDFTGASWCCFCLLDEHFHSSPFCYTGILAAEEDRPGMSLIAAELTFICSWFLLIFKRYIKNEERIGEDSELSMLALLVL